MQQKKEHLKEKVGLHPRNRHRESYNLNDLMKTCSELKSFVILTKHGESSIDFFNPYAVKTLNKALLKHHYGIHHWDIPDGYLCPPVPGRSDYLHYVADLLASDNNDIIPTGRNIRCLDIGVGANCIYPLIGNSVYDWSFVGSDIDQVAVANAQKIIRENQGLELAIEIRLQKNRENIFTDMIQPEEHFAVSMCNPPFHSSAADAQMGSQRKLNNLRRGKDSKHVLNFGGQNNELWYTGGEVQFLQQMILQSKMAAKSVDWFTSLVSKSEHLPGVYLALKKVDATTIKTIPMAQGNKISRIVAWRF